MENNTRRSFIKNLGMGIGSTTLIPSLTSFEKLSEEKRKVYQGKKLNIALCGLGRYANILAKSFVDSEYCHLAGIITGTPSKAIDWKKRYTIPDANIYNYQNFDNIRNNKDIDLVYVVLPNSMHKEYTIRAAKAGKHVIVEKPMAFTEKDCQEMIAVCKDAGVQLAVGYRLHYEPHHIEIKRLGQDKVFGQVRLIEVSLGYRINGNPNDWHFKKTMSGGGITWQLNFPSGAVCTSASAYNCGIDRFYASADNGFFELSPAVSYGPFKGRSSEREFNFPVINQQAAQMDGIAKRILENQNLPEHISGIEGSKDMRVIEAIYRAAESGKKVFL